MVNSTLIGVNVTDCITEIVANTEMNAWKTKIADHKESVSILKPRQLQKGIATAKWVGLERVVQGVSSK